jgi:hypothetical protein
VIPFMEKILGDYLREAPAVEAIVGDRVATKTPRTLEEPWVRINVLDDPPAGKSSADHVIAFYVQLDCYAGKKGDQVLANLLARTVRALLGEMAKHEHEEAVISGAKVHGSRPLPDSTLEPTMERYVVTATIWAHSTEEGS